LLGIAYGALERNPDAIRALRRAVQLCPRSIPGHVNLGIVYMQSQQMEAAAAELQSAVKLGDHEWSTVYNLAICYSATGKPNMAKPLLLKVASLAPNRYEPRLTLASVEFDLGEQNDAVSELGNAEALAPADWTLREKIGMLLMKHGMFDGAAREFDSVIRHNPAEALARLKLAEADLKLKLYQDTLNVLSFQSAPKWTNENDAVADYLSGAAHAGLQDWLSAIDDCQKAIKLDPKPAYYAELVRILLKAQAMEDALGYARTAVEKFPDSLDTLRAMANAAVANDVTVEAIPALQSMIRLKTDDQETYVQLASLYLTAGKFGMAQEVYSAMRERFPKSEEPYFGFALIQLRENKIPQAKGYLQEALELNPKHAGALYYLGKLLYGEGQIPQSLEYLKRSEALTPSYSSDLVSIQYLIARCYVRLGDKDKAQEEFAKVKKQLGDQQGSQP
jgi:tetratricopeptide (TPR) repeat protein